MKAEIINIGDELLIGQVVNTNASWMAQELSLIGIAVKQISIIPDQHEDILTALREAENRADIILITGGLGPTRDDITKTCLCEYFGTSLVFNQDVYDNIEAMFARRGFKMTAVNRQQADVPASCTPIQNNNGTAPGMWFERNNKIFVSMPGVPFEMKPIMSDDVLPELARRFVDTAIIHKTILTQGIGESLLASKIESWEDQLPANMKLAYLPQPGIVRLRITAKGNDKAILQKAVEAETEKLLAIIPDLVFGFDEESLEEVVGRLLKERKASLSTAESCTGGNIAHRITSVAGSSQYYYGGMVAYANEIKSRFLGVSAADLENFGAVSEQVVTQMARGAREHFRTDYAIATSGIAGPDGGTDAKPVGTIWIAIADPVSVKAYTFQFVNNRERNITLTTVTALNLLRKTILNH